MAQRLLKIGKWVVGIVLGIFLTISLLLYIFKDDICDMAIAKVNQYLDAKVYVNKVDLAFWGTFPNLSVDFEEVYVADNFPGISSTDTLLYSDRLRFKFNPMDLWNENYTVKSLEVDKGILHLKVDSAGVNNYKILKENTDTTSSDFALQLEHVEFNDFRFKYSNSATHQMYYTSIEKMDVKGELHNSKFNANASSGLIIHEARSGEINFVKNQPANLNVQVHVDTDSIKVNIPSSTISIAELPFNFDFDYDSIGYRFNLSGKEISVADAANKLSLKQTADVNNFSGTGELLFQLNVNGENNSDNPATIDCSFGIKNGSLIDPSTQVKLEQLNLEGSYNNTDQQVGERLKLDNISFASTGGLFKGNLLLFNFEEPEFKGNANGHLHLPTLQSFIRIPFIEQISGNVAVASKFHVKTFPQPSGETFLKILTCSGNMEIKNTSVKLKEDKRVFKNINGSTYLNDDEVGLENIQLAIGNSDFNLNGTFKRISDYLSNQGQLVADVNLISKRINIADIGSDSKEEIRDGQRSFLLPDDIAGNAFIQVQSMFYEGHLFENMVGKMVVGKRLIHFPDISIRNGGADARGSITIEEKRPEIFYISSQLVSNNISFKPLFKEWNNFQQDVILSDNISGTVAANIEFTAPFDFRSGIISNAIQARIGLKIKDGRLKNVETFKYITQSLKETPSARLAIGKDNINAFEKKLLDLQFEDLTNTLIIKNSVLTIPSMSIHSNALDVEASGHHTFSNKIDYRIGFRFRDIKEKETSEFGEIEDDGSGAFVFLRMFGDLSNPSIEWDKAASREQRKQEIAQEKEDVKSILKTEFGLYKKDTTIQEYIHVKKEHETIEVEFNPEETVDPIIDQKKPKKDTRINRFIDKMREETEAEKEKSIEIEGL